MKSICKNCTRVITNQVNNYDLCDSFNTIDITCHYYKVKCICGFPVEDAIYHQMYSIDTDEVIGEWWTWSSWTCNFCGEHIAADCLHQCTNPMESHSYGKCDLCGDRTTGPNEYLVDSRICYKCARVYLGTK